MPAEHQLVDQLAVASAGAGQVGRQRAAGEAIDQRPWREEGAGGPALRPRHQTLEDLPQHLRIDGDVLVGGLPLAQRELVLLEQLGEDRGEGVVGHVEPAVRTLQRIALEQTAVQKRQLSQLARRLPAPLRRTVERLEEQRLEAPPVEGRALRERRLVQVSQKGRVFVQPPLPL